MCAAEIASSRSSGSSSGLQANQDAHLLASLLSPRDLSSLKQHMTATGTVIRDSPTSSTILQSGACVHAKLLPLQHCHQHENLPSKATVITMLDVQRADKQLMPFAGPAMHSVVSAGGAPSTGLPGPGT